MNISPNDPAFPGASIQDASGIWQPKPGMTIRTQIAAMAMQGILANHNARLVYGVEDDATLAKASVTAADALITELNKPQP